MDALSRIGTWLSEHEAAISAVVGITVLSGILLAGARALLLRGANERFKKALVSPSRMSALVAAAVALLLACVGVIAWWLLPDDATRGVASEISTEASLAGDSSPRAEAEFTVPGFGGAPAIAVLAFDNLSGDPEQEYFADGIAEDLITRLSRWRRFPVVARNSSFTYKGKAVDVKQVSRELGVRYVVEGSVRKAGDRIRINVQLIDAAMGAHLWAETYDRELRDIFAIQDEIVEAVVGSMNPALEKSEMRRAMRKQARNLGAYDYRMRGRWHLAKFTKEDNAKARAFLEEAIELDPEDAHGFAFLAITHYYDILFQWTDSPARSLELQLRAARRCVELDVTQAGCRWPLALAHGLAGQRDQALAAAALAVEFDPSSVVSRTALCFLLGVTGKPDEGIAHCEAAMRLSPRDPLTGIVMHCIAMAHFGVARYQQAAQWERRSLQLDPGYYIAHGTLAASYAYLGQQGRARAALQDMLRLNARFSAESIGRVFSPADAEYVEKWLDGLRKAGWEGDDRRVPSRGGIVPKSG